MTGKIRIIAGRWRGRKLPVADRPGLRPTGDRARETLFNWIGPRIVGAHVLDLFAGSGALGLEAASRGAGKVVLVERDAVAAAHLRDGPMQWPESGAVELHQRDALSWLQQKPQAFDLVLVDPPFSSDLHDKALMLLTGTQGWLAENALIYVESSPDGVPVQWPDDWAPLRQKPVGQTLMTLLTRSAQESPRPRSV